MTARPESMLDEMNTMGIEQKLVRNARRRLDPTVAIAVAKRMLLDPNSDTVADFVLSEASMTVAEVMVHPSFVRAAARLGFAFYHGADGGRHKFSVRDSEVCEDVAEQKPGREITQESDRDWDFYVPPYWYQDLGTFVEEGATVLLIGPPGVGKTEAVRRIFKNRGQPLQRVKCKPSMTADDVEGEVWLRKRGEAMETVFEPSRVTTAVRDGHGLLLDEFDALPAGASFALFDVLDGDNFTISRLGEDGVIKPHPDLRIIATQNTEGRGDDQGLHHGRAYQDEACLDRFENIIRADWPDKDIEAEIIARRTGIDAIDAMKIVDAANVLRKALRENKIGFCCSMRRTLAIARNLARGHGSKVAWSYGALNRMARDDADNVPDLLQRVYGSWE